MTTDIEVRYDVINHIVMVGSEYPEGHDFKLTCSLKELWAVITYCREGGIPIEYVGCFEDGVYDMSTASSHRLLAKHELER